MTRASSPVPFLELLLSGKSPLSRHQTWSRCGRPGRTSFQIYTVDFLHFEGNVEIGMNGEGHCAHRSKSKLKSFVARCESFLACPNSAHTERCTKMSTEGLGQQLFRSFRTRSFHFHLVRALIARLRPEHLCLGSLQAVQAHPKSHARKHEV